jgi:FkbM family methyltransferase
MFETRDRCEPNFRLLIRWLYNNNILDKHKNIVDLGAWIGDNSIPWAKVIDGYVYAIDPSIDNINYIKELMYLNVIKNVIPIISVISDKEEIVYSSGDIRHTDFSAKTGTNVFKTTSLDNLYSSLEIENIGFIHLDVEGFEFKVLSGSRKIINDCRPIIAWENHLDTDDVSGTVSFFSSYNYDSYMINEFFPHCRRTCRNFISLPKEKGIIIEDINTHFTETSNKSIHMMPFLIRV